VRIGLIVGNGLSLSFRTHAGSRLARWDTSSPLSWPIGTPGKGMGNIPLLESLLVAHGRIPSGENPNAVGFLKARPSVWMVSGEPASATT
jgi:hypothetical protein